MSDMIDVALLQMTAGPVIADNLNAAEGMIRDAAAGGARFILTPENTCHMVFPMQEKLRTTPVEADNPIVKRFSELARELNVTILLGSIAVKVAANTIQNRSYLFNAKGDIVAKYDKIHLFDVSLPNGELYKESALVQPGGDAVVADAGFAKIGMTICYDIRFAQLYRMLAKAGASIITVPSAFTVPTGQAHWETLLRARAIETGCYILAPAQTGEHAGGRLTWGHSMVVDPWGAVVAQGGSEVGIITARLDLSAVEKARQSVPSLLHDRDFSNPL